MRVTSAEGRVGLRVGEAGMTDACETVLQRGGPPRRRSEPLGTAAERGQAGWTSAQAGRTGRAFLALWSTAGIGVDLRVGGESLPFLWLAKKARVDPRTDGTNEYTAVLLKRDKGETPRRRGKHGEAVSVSFAFAGWHASTPCPSVIPAMVQMWVDSTLFDTLQWLDRITTPPFFRVLEGGTCKAGKTSTPA